jgi:hypothetical protein
LADFLDKKLVCNNSPPAQVLKSVSERLVSDMRQMEKELSAAHAAAEARILRSSYCDNL